MEDVNKLELAGDACTQALALMETTSNLLVATRTGDSEAIRKIATSMDTQEDMVRTHTRVENLFNVLIYLRKISIKAKYAALGTIAAAWEGVHGWHSELYPVQ